MKNHPDNFIDCVQGSAEWFDARVGRVTASRVADALSMLKRNGGSSAKRESYKIDLLTEILTANPVEHYVSPAMDFGIENEPIARSAYEMQTGAEVELIGFVIHPAISRAGASPDGLVGDDGLVEFKVPNGTTHLQYLIDDVVPEEYAMQMFWEMACTGRKWCDFVSYAPPPVPDDFSLFIKRLKRDDEFIEKMEAGVLQFISEVNDMASVLRQRRGSGALKVWQQGRESSTPESEFSGPPRAIIPEMA